MKAMRRGRAAAADGPAASNFAGGSMASSIGRATRVPNPFKKVRRGRCQDLFIIDDILRLISRGNYPVNGSNTSGDLAQAGRWRQSSGCLRELMVLAAAPLERGAFDDFQDQG